MLFKAVSLNGTWEMKYTEEGYCSEENPFKNISEEEDLAGTEPKSICGDFIENAVPGYWEDMTEAFQMASFYSKLRFNPEYGVQKYPIAGNPPDMALPNITGTFFYRKKFMYSKTNGDKTLHFEGVQNSVSAWINDVYLGRHLGYSTPFEIKIPEECMTDGENTIVLSVSNCRLKGYRDEPVSGLTSRAANECTGGITGDVEIRTYKSEIKDIAVLISEDLKSADVYAEGKAPLSWFVCDKSKVIRSGTANGSFSFLTDGLKLWSPEDPMLYTLKIKCGEAEAERKFGVRRLTADKEALYLNGYKYLLRGACEHCYFPKTIHPVHDKAYYQTVIENLKKLGFNFIRFHTYIPPEEYMQAADELGMLLQVECPNNTTICEWREIVRFCRRHTSVIIYCCGNELLIDDPFIEYLKECADDVHTNTDALFAPMSAMRGIEYFWCEPEQEKELKEKPFKHHPRRLKALGEFCDVYCTYPNGAHSYFSLDCEPKKIDEYAKVYQKPRLSHEICIDGTYTDLSLKQRYKGLRVGETQMFSSIEKHLEEKGILGKASVYFKNSCEWQRRVRKFCFENVRLSGSISGYDFLGPIDTHWHTFGYDVGMMNEFYELKPGETLRNIRMYNSESVILTDIGKKRNYEEGESFCCNIFVSYYGRKMLGNTRLTIRLFVGETVQAYDVYDIKEIQSGKVTNLITYSKVLPKTDKPQKMRLYASLDGDSFFAENEWEMYLFPKTKKKFPENTEILYNAEEEQLFSLLEQGKNIVLFGAEPFVTLPTSFRIALAGRSSGNLATVIYKHPILNDFLHEGFCGWQFAGMLEGGSAVCFESDKAAFLPIIEVASVHKCAVRQAALFEYRAINGKIIVCGFNLSEKDPGAMYLKEKIIEYAAGESFAPENYIDKEALFSLIHTDVKKTAGNTNLAFNANDKTAVRKKRH